MNDWEMAAKFDEYSELAASKSEEAVKNLDADSAFKLRDLQKAWAVMADSMRGTADPKKVKEIRDWAKKVLGQEGNRGK